MTAREFLAGHPLAAGRRVSRRRHDRAGARRRVRHPDARSRPAAPICRRRSPPHARRLPDDRDRALAAEIATGVMRWRAALDHLIVAFAKRPIDRLDQEIVEILRLSTYQLLHLTRVPASAVVDDAVDLAKRAESAAQRLRQRGAAIAVATPANALPLPPRPDRDTDREAVLDYFSITLSHPRWLAERWYDRLGFDAAEALAPFQQHAGAGDAPGRTGCGSTRDDLTRAPRARRLSSVRPTAFAPDGLIVESGHPLRGGGRRGRCVRRAGRGVAARRAPGGTVARQPRARCLRLARRKDDRRSPPRWTTTGLLVACDVRDRRIELLRRTVIEQRRDQHPRRAGRPAAAAAVLVAVRSACSSMRPAPASARCAAIRTSAGAGTNAISARSRAAELTMLQQRRRRGRAGRPTDLRDLLERTGRERRTWSIAFLATTPGFAPIDARSAHRRRARGSRRRARPPQDRTAPPRPGRLLRRRVRAPHLVRTDPVTSMALGTRVWGAGKVTRARRRAGWHLRAVRRRVDARRAAHARGPGSRSDQPHGERSSRASRATSDWR